MKGPDGEIFKVSKGAAHAVGALIQVDAPSVVEAMHAKVRTCPGFWALSQARVRLFEAALMRAANIYNCQFQAA